MTIHISEANIIAVDAAHGTRPFKGDILIEGSRIAHVGEPLVTPDGARRIDGRNRLVIPGLVNAHVHSWEAMFKGRYDNMPLEIWMLYSYPLVGTKALDPRLIYLRSMIVAMESLKNGVTCLVDDIIELPVQGMDAIDAVFDAYHDIGIRANVSGHVINRPFVDTIPFTREYLPRDLIADVSRIKVPTVKNYLDFAGEVVKKHQDRSDRLRYLVAPSGPQRCTEEMLKAVHDFAREIKSAYHIHVLETKVQAVAGREFYGRTLVQYLDDLGVLTNISTLAHSIWVTDRDIACMAERGSSVAHNPISNQKLGAGIAPFRKLLDAGVNVALGSDGISSNDTSRMLDVMQVAGLLHKVTTPEYGLWPTASEIIYAATMGGARSVQLQNEIGSIETGKRADLVLFDLETINFTPQNDLLNHLVYCENGSSVEKVFVNGEIVVDDGELTKVNEGALVRELRERYDAFSEHHKGVEELNRRFEPYFKKIHKHCCGENIELNRYSAPPNEWLLS
ncbi:MULTISPECIES: amidohydrolase family protein [Aminobacter]|jgi:cytosine/adenosine deaminase-related metal-dependent hydrolase|uniref:Cytosine/adenosine deaminase-related metal-dependent hydrolase n=1 Tax=Aminobacter ciceronei TaxID=150723 RepID=A0ABR6CIU0_9HYPH|nr:MULTISPECIES: amidohydrolase [Aminobacter]MBA8910765.1 cytosine/adenosine deaminase-related metal-dependent hydrolase [Aminobacter ciceronei]MBA9024538.1 cytosine/adenosine deaminase-related metal-dependent hydrolase [Aminobacter ciceronei]MRX37517.1 amidohydrolase family protein [Aminobacter sp. MDW-2]QNH35544.1 amidohydrolase [Aminobacter sp. MDW-2]